MIFISYFRYPRSLVLVLYLIFLGSCVGAGKYSIEKGDNPGQLEPTFGSETVVILGTNDIHGNLLPQTRKSREPSAEMAVTYTSGGLSVLASFINILRKEFGPRLLWLDAGDQFQGTMESNLNQGEAVVSFFNFQGLSAAAIGNHEFDFGAVNTIGLKQPPENQDPENQKNDPLGAIKTRMKQARFPYLAANIVQRQSLELYRFPNTYPRFIFRVGNLKLGVLGLSTLDTPKTTRSKFIKDLQFTNLLQATQREAKTLRDQGAHIVLLTAHVGLKCDLTRTKAYATSLSKNDTQGECNSADEMVRLLESLPPGTLDGVVSGHSHQIVHHWVGGVPVIQSGALGKYIHLIHLTYDWSQKKILPELSKIEGPIPICTKTFKNQGDCNGDRPPPHKGRGPLIPATFRGQYIVEDQKVLELFKPFVDQANERKSEIITRSLQPLEHRYELESPLGNSVADAMRYVTRADIALMNSGGVRAPLEPMEIFQSGKLQKDVITYGTVFRSLPFDNDVVTLKVSGKELRQVLRISHSGSRGFPAISGAKLKLIDLKYEAPATDLNQDGKLEHWETNRVLEIHVEKPSTTSAVDYLEIEDEKTYSFATIDFLAQGGDDVGWALSQIPPERQTATHLILRDAYVQYLRSLPSPLDHRDWLTPRITFENPASRNK